MVICFQFKDHSSCWNRRKQNRIWLILSASCHLLKSINFVQVVSIVSIGLSFSYNYEYIEDNNGKGYLSPTIFLHHSCYLYIYFLLYFYAMYVKLYFMLYTIMYIKLYINYIEV